MGSAMEGRALVHDDLKVGPRGAEVKGRLRDRGEGGCGLRPGDAGEATVVIEARDSVTGAIAAVRK